VEEQPRPLIAHLIYRLDVGGLENGLVNLINSGPAGRYRHVIICLTDAAPFRRRIGRADVEIIELQKRPGQDWGLYRRLWRLFRRLRPAILHTRNLAALEGQLPGLCAGIGRRVHSEHGLEMQGARYTLLRKALRGVVDVYIPLSKDLQRWLTSSIGVPESKIVQIYNGVDTSRFHPRQDRERAGLPAGFAPESGLVIGTVGRLARIKDQATLVSAFAQLVESRPKGRDKLRLAIVGDGDMKAQLLDMIRAADVADISWLPGARDDVPEVLRSLDLFVLPSISEGVSNSILEAMASGLPVIATSVGGNPELVADGVTGRLVPASDPGGLCSAIAQYVDSPALMLRHGEAGRQRCLDRFSIDHMVESYLAVYDELLSGSVPALKQCQTTP
jgi:sugar transferase (PEP-CTERM/EpsH1 system associated)